MQIKDLCTNATNCEDPMDCWAGVGREGFAVGVKSGGIASGFLSFVKAEQ